MNFDWTSREKRLGALLAIISLVLASTVYYVATEVPAMPDHASGSLDEAFDLADGGLNPQEMDKQPQQPEQLWIDLKGAVAKPGVYSLKEESRLHEAIQLAGGLLPDAEPKAINLAMPLQDGQMVYVPFKGELPESQQGLPIDLAVQDGDGKINLNSASKEQLCELPGIGDVKAQSILEYRDKNKGFKTLEELKEVQGIGEKIYEKLKDQIRLR